MWAMLDPAVTEHGPGQPTPRMLRQFAGIWLVFFGGLAVWQGVVRDNAAWGLILGIVAVTFGPLGLVKPAAIRPIFAAWMGVALVIGAVVSRLILAALFYLVFTPVGLLFRLIGRDELRLRRIDTESYWTEKERPRDVRSYLRQS
jgi:hypothetical protein